MTNYADYSRKTKIVATLGTSTCSKDIIKKLKLAGADVFRLNFSHWTHEIHKRSALYIREIEQELAEPITILADLQGPKIRLGIFEDGQVVLKPGSKFLLLLDKVVGSHTRVSLPHPEIFNAAQPGTELLIDDGKIKLLVISNSSSLIETEVINGGVVSNKKGVSIPGVVLPISSITEKDKRDIEQIRSMGADWIALSFVQTAEDVLHARSLIPSCISLITKIEKPSAATTNLEAIIVASDAIMVARGDLGAEMPFELIPGLQRKIIGLCLENRKPVIVATQILESMKCSITPTRAEVSDIETAIIEGADAVMLSAETAIGKYPVQAVETMAKVARQIEIDILRSEGTYTASRIGSNSQRNTCARSNGRTLDIGMTNAVCAAIDTCDIQFIAAFTESGATAINVSNGRPRAQIIALTPNINTLRRMCIVWGVRASLVEELCSFSQLAQIVKRNITMFQSNGQNCKVAIVAGIPFRISGITNILHVIDLDKLEDVE
jgi:pyruvate kinase